MGRNSRLIRSVACHSCVHFAACQHPGRYFHTSDVKPCPKEKGEKHKDVLHSSFLCCFLQDSKSLVHVRHHATRQKQATLVPPPDMLPSVCKSFMGVNSAEETDVLIREKTREPCMKPPPMSSRNESWRRARRPSRCIYYLRNKLRR